jgi:N-methylhydantoinase B
MDHTETIARAILAQIPEGEYRFAEYFEDDYVSDIPVKLEVCLRSRGDGTVQLDFTGSDPQVKSALNMPLGGQKHHPFLSRTFLNYIITKEPTIAWNGGMLRCVDLVLPEASVVNCEFPAACGMRATTSIRVHDAVLGALMQAVPDVVPAGGASQVAVTYVSMQGSGAGGRVVSANPIQGGSGGSAAIDGLSGSDRPLAYLRNVPTEILEFEGPVIVHRFGLVRDSEGAGRNRGGFGVEFELELLHPEATLVTRGKDRHRFSAWGAQGGSAGTTCTNYARMPGEEPTYLGKITVYRPRFGEIVTLRGGGGGGYGDPFERDPEKVWADVQAGLVSPERALDVYGVVLGAGGVDPEATMALRADAVRPDAAEFDFGPGRTAFMASHEEALDALRAYWWSLPAALRSYARTETWNRLNALDSAPYTAADAERVVGEFDGFLRSRGLL